MYLVFAPDGTRIGMIIRFVGSMSVERWVAYSCFPSDYPAEQQVRKAFRARREAHVWLEQQYRQHKGASR
jgi:hypothetical protein